MRPSPAGPRASRCAKEAARVPARNPELRRDVQRLAARPASSGLRARWPLQQARRACGDRQGGGGDRVVGGGRRPTSAPVPGGRLALPARRPIARRGGTRPWTASRRAAGSISPMPTIPIPPGGVRWRTMAGLHLALANRLAPRMRPTVASLSACSGCGGERRCNPAPPAPLEVRRQNTLQQNAEPPPETSTKNPLRGRRTTL